MALTSPLTSTVVRAGGFMVSEMPGLYSRDNITVLSGENLAAGAVLERVLVGASVAGAAAAGNTGNGTIGTLTAGNASQEGVYTAVVVEPAANGGTFVVEDPQGREVGRGNVAAAFTGGGIGFTIADGATDFAVGDRFNITVSAGGFKYREYDPANTDASLAPAGILWDAVDASAADKPGAAITKGAVVNAGELTWFPGATTGQKTAAIQAMDDVLNIRARPAV